MPKRGPLVRVAALGALVLLVGACGGAPSGRTLRQLNGETLLGPVVSSSAYRVYLQAEHAFVRNDLRVALERFRDVRSRSAPDPYLASREVASLRLLNELDQAERLLRDELEVFPTSESLWLERSRLFRAQARPEQALRAARSACEHAPLSPRGPLLVDELLESRSLEALEDLGAYLHRNPQPPLSIWRRILERALLASELEWLSRAARRLDTDFPGALSDTGLELRFAPSEEQLALFCEISISSRFRRLAGVSCP